MAKVWLNNKLQKLAMKKKNAYVTRVVVPIYFILKNHYH